MLKIIITFLLMFLSLMLWCQKKEETGYAILMMGIAVGWCFCYAVIKLLS